MAGQIIISNIKTDSDNAFSILANTGAVIFSANLASGIAGSFITNNSITGSKIALGTITGDDIATGQITGNLIATNAISQNNIVSVNASVATVGTLPAARLPAGTVLQVVSNTKTDTFSTTSTSYVDITGLSVSITPISSNSKIYISYLVNGGINSELAGIFIRLVRNSTPIAVADTAGSRPKGTNQTAGSIYIVNTMAGSFLDSPATTSATTYKIQMFNNGGVDSYINRSVADRDTSAFDIRTVSSITIMEIAG
jgi:hypothetical protein